MNRRAMTIRTAICLALALVLSACGSGGAPKEKPPLEGAAIGGPFTLKDKAGKDVRWSDFAGKYRIVYFGYTFCPDACPLDMSVTIRGFNQFAKEHPDLAAQVQPIFITIDPARDTPARVGEFAAAFSPKLIGLTGTTEEIAAAAKAFAVPYGKGKETEGGYLMDHGRTTYLMDRDGKAVRVQAISELLAGPLEQHLDWAEE
jgi:protein SCO1/2